MQKRSRQVTGRGPVMLALGLLLAVVGCREREPASSPASDAPPATARRIVCGSPAITEIVFALGCGDRVVGVSDYTIYPPEALRKQRVGGRIDPNRERLLVLQPDIIISQGLRDTIGQFAETYGIGFHSVKLDTLADIHAAVDSIAAVLGVPGRGRELNAGIRSALQGIRTRAAAASASPPRTLLVFGRTPGNLGGLATTGPGTFLHDLIGIAGGTNIFGDATGAYPQISKEALLLREPEVILEINPGSPPPKTLTRLRNDWQAFPDLPAVRNGRIHYLTNDFLLIPGPRIGLIAEELARAIAPSRFRSQSSP